MATTSILGNRSKSTPGGLTLFSLAWEKGPTLSGSALFAQFRHVVNEVMRSRIAGSGFAGEIMGCRHDFLVGGVFGILERWCGEGCPEPSETILDALDGHVRLVMNLATFQGAGMSDVGTEK